MTNNQGTKNDKVRICAFGTFDIIHVGHVLLLESIKPTVQQTFFPDHDLNQFHLTIIVARDVNVEKYKKKPPIFSENDRLKIISAIRYVDQAILGEETGSKFDILETIDPDVVVLGYDQWASEEELLREGRQRGLSFKVTRLKKFDMKLASSSSVKKAINSNSK